MGLVADLADPGTQCAGADRAREDGRREEETERDATDDAPLEARLGAVVGDLAEVDLAFGVAAGDDDAVDAERARALDLDELLDRRPRRRSCSRTTPTITE